MADTRAKYLEYVTALLKLADIADAEAKAKSVVALETRIARAHASIIDTQDVHKANNPWAMADFTKKAPGLDWTAYFTTAGLASQKTIVAWQPAAITKLARTAS